MTFNMVNESNQKPIVGHWALIEPNILNSKGTLILPFVAQIKKVNDLNKIIEFNTNSVFHTDGSTRMPSNVNGKTLDYSYYSWIKKTSKDKKNLFLNEIRIMIREILKEILE